MTIAGNLQNISGLAAINSLMAMVGGRGGVSFFSQLLVTAKIVIFTLLASILVCGILKMTVGIRIRTEERGATAIG